MSLRLFAALAIPGAAAVRLTALMRGVPGARWRPRENLHLTLRFFGEIAEPIADDIDASLAAGALGIAPFDVTLKGVGIFGGANPHTLWAGVAPSAPLTSLAGVCERAARDAGLKKEARGFTPHVTLAYLNNPDRDRLIAFEQRSALFEAAPWRAERFGLYSSQARRNAPSLYRLEAEYKLG